jgi:hypothetical protein
MAASGNFGTARITAALLIVFLFIGCNKSYESDNQIKDPYFLDALIRAGVDRNGDGEINQQEANAVEVLDVSNDSIKSLSGIEMFAYLENLNVSENLLYTLDISHNIYLKHLSIAYNYNLYKVCVPTLPFPPEGGSLNSQGCSKVKITTDCGN